jgi:hypothetical protein
MVDQDRVGTPYPLGVRGYNPNPNGGRIVCVTCRLCKGEQ